MFEIPAFLPEAHPRVLTRRLLLLACSFALSGCVTQQVSPESGGGTGDAATMDRPITTEVVRMDSGIAALQAFDPLVPRITEGGECVTSDLPADGVRSVTLVYPTMRDPRTQITVVMDAAGSILRYTERRGGLQSRTATTRSTDPVDGPEQTTIEMNFQTGQARAINSGGGTVGFGVQGSTQDFQYQENLGQPIRRAQEVQERCGGRN